MKRTLRTLLVASLLAAGLVPTLASAADQCTIGLTCATVTWSRGTWGAASLNFTFQGEHEAVGGVSGELSWGTELVDTCQASEACTTGPVTRELAHGKCVQLKATSINAAGSRISDSETVCAVNPGFEIEDGVAGADCPPAGWDHYVFGAAGQPVCRSTEDARTGSASAKFVDTISGGSGSYAGLMSPKVSVGAGEDARVRGSTKIVSGNALFVYVLWFDANGADNGIVQVANPGSSTWQDFDQTRTAPSGTASAALLVYSCTGCVTTAYLDDASIAKV